ncbi:MAG TPA: hypothetical protein VMD99_09170 [Terriglobales bacterium]|nr:hypothetical protein [Terriglobales bacterium]
MNSRKKFLYAAKVLPGAMLRARPSSAAGAVHLIIALADHFEPAIDPGDGQRRVSRTEQERRLECWKEEYPKAVDRWRDSEGRPFVHTYFYPAEQYDVGLVEILADHCHSGWGETEVHLHHGITEPDTPENTRRLLSEFRDQLTYRHRCLALEEGSDLPRYCFVHGNFALANSAAGQYCGVDSEMKILAETGCYADFTLPTAPGDPAQTAKINSLYECALPIEERAPQRRGIDLRAGRPPRTLPLIIQGPLLVAFGRNLAKRLLVIENGAITAPNPMTLDRLSHWKRARIHVGGRPDWLFIKLHCHGMDPTQKDVVIGAAFRRFLEELVGGAESRKEMLHFVTAREMANIALAACDGREGNPGDYRDYRFRRVKDLAMPGRRIEPVSASAKG